MAKGQRTINKIIIHHSASPRASTSKELVKQWHVEERGWNDIGYHYMLNNKDEIETGRHINKQGAHCLEQNADSIGICVFGNYEGEIPTAKQVEVLRMFVNSLLDKYNLSWQNVYGHKDFGNTACPGKNLYGVLQQLKQQNS